MKLLCLSDNVDTALGMRLAGIEGMVIHDREKLEKALEEAALDKSIGIVLITEKLSAMAPELVLKYKLYKTRPLVTEIPDRHGGADISAAIAGYIKEAVGIEV